VQLSEKEAAVRSLEERLKGKEDLLKTVEMRLDTAVKSEARLKEQLNGEIARAFTVNATNFNLKHTLVDSQQEMDSLVSRYERAVEDLISRDNKI